MTQAAHETWLDALQAHVANRLDLDALRGKRIAAIIGDTPSTYAKSPRLWNAAFEALGLPAVYVPLDVTEERLPDLLQLLRAHEAFLGGSVTVPYKQRVMPLLDRVDALAAQIGAVNVIARADDGTLAGHNTDGPGGVQALAEHTATGRPLPLDRARVLLLGAGGAGQALACALWQRMSEGELVIANRTDTAGASLARRLASARAGRVAAVGESAIPEHASRADLIINATTKGQQGVRTLPDGQRACLEPYSALGPAAPAPLSAAEASSSGGLASWYQRSLQDIRRNHEVSLAVCAAMPPETLCYDIVYAPAETTFLRHARWSGHETLNGRAMNVRQAVEAFVRYVCRDWLAQGGADAERVYGRVTRAMSEVWGS